MLRVINKYNGVEYNVVSYDGTQVHLKNDDSRVDVEVNYFIENYNFL